jgi:hypothetical protein
MVHRFVPNPPLVFSFQDLSLTNWEIVEFMEEYQGNIDLTIHMEKLYTKMGSIRPPSRLLGA